ncbi:hypothetical protein AVEN_207812-1 [Araneus ventricosus]|uniref:Uncharacterized protein n=1 Tax=Araneus ventricosus TaxID=182803 RepID=A0A4Y2BWL8_ARAVE|nr:hypothetical protein AVEN_207812-1 [Araneus ventricosus]
MLTTDESNLESATWEAVWKRQAHRGKHSIRSGCLPALLISGKLDSHGKQILQGKVWGAVLVAGPVAVVCSFAHVHPACPPAPMPDANGTGMGGRRLSRSRLRNLQLFSSQTRVSSWWKANCPFVSHHTADGSTN